MQEQEQLNGVKFLLVTYVNEQSANMDSERDFYIGDDKNQVGNSSTLKDAQVNDIVLIAFKGGKEFIFARLGKEIPPEDIRCTAWENEGGQLWKYNFEIAEKMTPIIKRTKIIEKFIREECFNAKKINRLFHPNYFNVDYTEIYEKLLTKLLRSDDMMSDPICEVENCSKISKSNGFCGRHRKRHVA